MRPFPALVLGGTLLISVRGQQQYLPGLSGDVSDLSTFFDLLNSTTDLYSTVAQGDVTILAPTNDAFAAAGLTQANSTSSSELEALLRYHVLEGVHSKASLAGETTFYPTLLQSIAQTNLTGGQVVEATSINGTDALVSGVFAQSTITQADVSYQNGVIQIIDTVLTIPLQIAQSVVAANLGDFVALSQEAQLGSTSIAPYLSGLQRWPDTTFFAPNSPQYGANFTGWDNLSLAQYLDIWNIHFINGTVLYSSNATNGSTFTTAGGVNITTWLVGSDLYINDAKVIQHDLLQANGVIQVLDKPLDPNNPNARPASFAAQGSTNTSSTGSSSSGTATPVSGGLSTGAKAGIGIGVALGVLAVIGGICAWFFIKRRRSNVQNQATELEGNTVHESPAADTKGKERAELGDPDTSKWIHEMWAHKEAHELDSTDQRPAVTEAASPSSPVVSPLSNQDER